MRIEDQNRLDVTGAQAVIDRLRESRDPMYRIGLDAVELAKDLRNQKIAEREQFLRNNPDHRKIVGGPDLKGMQDSLTIGENISTPGTNPMVRFRLAKAFNGLDKINVAITMMKRYDQTRTDEWLFEGNMTYDESGKIGQQRWVSGNYNTDTRSGIVRFYERKA
jgi:hypothetical protein